MLVLIVATAAGLLAGYALGGRLHNLEHLSLRMPWLVLLSLAIQLVIFTSLGDGLGESASLVAHVATYALLLVFVAFNVGRPGVVLAGFGALLNATVIVANGGYMPASTRALEIAGLSTTVPTHNNSMVADGGVHLLRLGDVMAVPGSIPLLSNVFSIGDVVIALGVAILLAAGMCSSLPVTPAHAIETP